MRTLLLFLTLVSFNLHASPFEAVFITDADVAALGGKFPLPRRHLAAALTAAGRAEARGIVLKFFLDQPAPIPADDNALAEAIGQSKISVVLQANLEPTQGVSTALPERFLRQDLPNADGYTRGSKGWIPLPIFLEGAAAVGFIDGLNPAPLLETYQGQAVPSLFLAALEMALGNASFGDRNVTLNAKTLPLVDGKLSLPFPSRDDLNPISLSELLSGKANSRLKGSIVILGYDGKMMAASPTPLGPIKRHRLFIYELELAHAAFAGGTAR